MNSFQPSVPLDEWIQDHSDLLYKSNLVMLREMVQNAIDATRMTDLCQTPLIEVSYEKEGEHSRLIVSDNGIGMTLEEQKRSFWKPYGSTKKRLPPEERLQRGIIGQFGIGAYAGFGVARRIMIISRSANGSGPRELTGTWGALEQPSSESPGTPQPSFGELDQDEINKYWNKRNSRDFGTTVVLELTKELDMQEVRRWLERACALLPRETVLLQDTRVEPLRLPNVTSLGNIRVIQLSASQPGEIKSLTIEPVKADNGRLGVRIIAAYIGQGHVLCGGLVFLSQEREIPGDEAVCADMTDITDYDRLIFYKHQFHFLEVGHDKLNVNSHSQNKCLPLTGFLDFPFLNPHPSREAFDRETDEQVQRLLASISMAIAETLAEIGGEALRSCHKFFDFIWDRSKDVLARLLRNYPFREYDSDKTFSLGELQAMVKSEKPCRIVYLLAVESVNETKYIAKSLATLPDHLVLDLDGPQYWRGHALERALSYSVGAGPIHDKFVTEIVPESEYGDWQRFLGTFTTAVNTVLGTGWQVIIARMDPEAIRMRMAEDKSIAYVNFHNKEIQQLPLRGLIGTNLEAKIREWSYGEEKAREREENLTGEGRLLVTQKITRLVIVERPDATNYEPGKEDVFLNIRNNDEQFYCLRVPYVWQRLLIPFLKESNSSSLWEMRPGQSADLIWAGTRFNFILSRERGHEQHFPSLWISWHTGIVLKHPDQGFGGELRCPFQSNVFPARTGLKYFVVLPPWIGEALANDLNVNGSIRIGLSMMVIPGTSGVAFLN